jgi:hypothetical protein
MDNLWIVSLVSGFIALIFCFSAIGLLKNFTTKAMNGTVGPNEINDTYISTQLFDIGWFFITVSILLGFVSFYFLYSKKVPTKNIVLFTIVGLTEVILFIILWGLVNYEPSLILT